MERMTHQRANGIKTGYWSPETKENLVQRLAAYEDTGLEPRQIQALAAASDSPDEAAAGWISVEDKLLSAVSMTGVESGWSRAAWISMDGGVCMAPVPSGLPTGCPCPSRPRR